VPISRMQFGFAINNSKESSSDNDSGTIVRNKFPSHIISAVLKVSSLALDFVQTKISITFRYSNELKPLSSDNKDEID
ncbi:unnamed protein product, partial [Didymodactylos carnosus]